MTTYAKRPPHSDRLAQTAHKRQSIATAPAVAAVVVNDRLMGTTFTPSGAMVLARPRNLDEQASGSSGAEAASNAPSNTNAGVAPGNVCIPTPSVQSRHRDAQSPGESTATLENIVTIHTSAPSAFTETNWWGFAVVLAVAVYMAAIVGLASVVFQ